MTPPPVDPNALTKLRENVNSLRTIADSDGAYLGGWGGQLRATADRMDATLNAVCDLVESTGRERDAFQIGYRDEARKFQAETLLTDKLTRELADFRSEAGKWSEQYHALLHSTNAELAALRAERERLLEKAVTATQEARTHFADRNLFIDKCQKLEAERDALTTSGGMGRKADYATIIALCSRCHAKSHQSGWLAIGMSEEGRRRAAEQTEALWVESRTRGTDDDE